MTETLTEVRHPEWCDPALCDVTDFGNHRARLHTLTPTEDEDLVMVEREQFESDTATLSDARVGLRIDTAFEEDRVSLSVDDAKQLAALLLDAVAGVR